MADRTRLVDRLRYERDARIDHALFYWTQVFMAYNSNHMEGSTLTPEQTRQIYDTGRLLADADEQIRLDDAIETRNHFTAFNYVIDHADDPVDAGYVCRLHALLKRGTSQDGDPGFNVGGYKTRDNAIVQRMGVAMVRTVPAGDVPGMMERVYAAYAGLSDDPVRIAMCHWMFEWVHPFSDGNGRVGIGLGKSKEVPVAIKKGVDDAKKNMFSVAITKEGTVPHDIVGEFGAGRVLIMPAAPGTGVIAGGPARAVMELAGIKNVFAKSLGTNNAMNVVKAAADGLQKMQSPVEVAERRNMSVAQIFGGKENQ